MRRSPNSSYLTINHRSAYGPLHDELRHILEGLVRQLQITDQVNCGIILECAKRNLDAAVSE
jgi:hypothetical protein